MTPVASGGLVRDRGANAVRGGRGLVRVMATATPGKHSHADGTTLPTLGSRSTFRTKPPKFPRPPKLPHVFTEKRARLPADRLAETTASTCRCSLRATPRVSRQLRGQRFPMPAALRPILRKNLSAEKREKNGLPVNRGAVAILPNHTCRQRRG